MNSYLLNGRGTANAQHSTVAYGSGAYHLHNSGMREPNLYGPGANNSGLYNMERFCPNELYHNPDGYPYHHHHYKHHHMHPEMYRHRRRQSYPDYDRYDSRVATYPASMYPDGNPPMHSTMPSHPESGGFFSNVRSWFDRDILGENVPARGDAYSSDRMPEYRRERSHSPYGARPRRGEYMPYDSTGMYDVYGAHGGSHDSRDLHDECRLLNDTIRRDRWRAQHEEMT